VIDAADVTQVCDPLAEPAQDSSPAVNAERFGKLMCCKSCRRSAPFSSCSRTENRSEWQFAMKVGSVSNPYVTWPQASVTGVLLAHVIPPNRCHRCSL